MRQADVALYTATQLETVDARHHHVADNQVYLLVLQHLERRSTIAGSTHLVGLLHARADEG